MRPLPLDSKPAENGLADWVDRLPYREIWLCDFEYFGADGDIPTPVCVVAREARSGRTLRIWRNELVRLTAPPFDTGPDALFVAYFASAEFGCFMAWSPDNAARKRPSITRLPDLCYEPNGRFNRRSALVW